MRLGVAHLDFNGQSLRRPSCRTSASVQAAVTKRPASAVHHGAPGDQPKRPKRRQHPHQPDPRAIEVEGQEREHEHETAELR